LIESVEMDGILVGSEPIPIIGSIKVAMVDQFPDLEV
jgi:hypothetical protein